MMLKRLDFLLELLEKDDGFLLTTHERPDADGLGSEIGLAYLLKKVMSKDTVIYNQDAPPNFYNSQGYQLCSLQEHPELAAEMHDRTVIILDANTKSRIGKMNQFIKSDDANLLIVDHHEGEVPDFKRSFIYPHTGACCEIIYQLMELKNIKPPVHVAEALYRGIILDTGHFRYGKTSAKTHLIAADLLAQGVHPATVSEEIQSRWSFPRLIARKTLYQHIEFSPCRRIGWFSISHKEVQQIRSNDSSIFEEICTDIFEAKEFYIAILFVEREPNVVRASLRARFGMNLLPVINKFGGGGHATACGVRFQLPLQTAIEKLVTALLEEDNILPKKKSKR